MMRLHWAVALMAALAGFGLGRLSGGAEGEPLSQQALGSIEIEDELEEALALPFGAARAARYVTTLGGMDSERAQTIASVFEGDLSKPTQNEIRLFIETWAEFAPEAALNRALAWEVPSARAIGAGQAMEAWGRHHPVEARLGLEELEGDGVDEIRGVLSIGLVMGWADSGVDLTGLGPYVSQLKDWGRERTTRELVDRLATAQGYEAAMAWAESVPQDSPQSFRNLAFRKVALVVGAEDPEFVGDWLEPHRQHRYGQAGFRVLGRIWMTTAPHAALAWAADQPDDRARFLFINSGFDRWYQDAPDAASEWLSTMSGDGLADPARIVVALAERPKDPAHAARTALDVRDSDRRLDLFGKVLRAWSSSAPIDMADWIEKADLAEPEQALAEQALASISIGSVQKGGGGRSVQSAQGAAEQAP